MSSLGWSKISKFYQKKIYRLAMTNMTKYAHQINLEIIFRTNMTKTRHLNANMARMNINKTLTKKTAPFAQIMAVQLTRECLGFAHADHSQTEIDQLVSKPKNKNAYTAAPVPDQRRQHATSQHGQRAPGYSNDSSDFDHHCCSLCGETNHRSWSCKHGIPIQCYTCKWHWA